MALETRDPARVVAEVGRLLDERAPRCGPVWVVAVDGPSGSGKTTLSRTLRPLVSAPVVHMDALYPGWDGLAAAVSLLTTQVLEPLLRNEPAAYRRWDWLHDRWTRVVTVPSVPRLLVEGVGASVRPAGDYATVCVWVEAPRDLRFARGMARDGETYRPHWERWARQEAALFEADRTRERADVVLVTDET